MITKTGYENNLVGFNFGLPAHSGIDGVVTVGDVVFDNATAHLLPTAMFWDDGHNRKTRATIDGLPCVIDMHDVQTLYNRVMYSLAYVDGTPVSNHDGLPYWSGRLGGVTIGRRYVSSFAALKAELMRCSHEDRILIDGQWCLVDLDDRNTLCQRVKTYRDAEDGNVVVYFAMIPTSQAVDPPDKGALVELGEDTPQAELENAAARYDEMGQDHNADAQQRRRVIANLCPLSPLDEILNNDIIIN